MKLIYGFSFYIYELIYDTILLKGALNITRKGDMLEWHGVPQVNYWKSSNGNSCNMVSGKDPGDLPMNIHRGDNFTAFIGQLCRKVTFNYLKEVSFLPEKTRT